MNLDIRPHGDTLVVRVKESRIDAASAIQFKDRMQTAGQMGQSRVVLDLADVDFLDSSGLGAVVAVMKFYAPDIVLELAGLNPMVEKVFHLTRMDQVFRIHDSAGQALAAA